MSDDRVTLTRIATAHPAIRKELLAIYYEISRRLTGRAQVRFTEVLRSPERQTELYAQGRTKPGKIVTNAKAWGSAHQYGLAVDMCLIIDGKEASWDTVADHDRDGIADWMECVAVFDKYGWEWAGRWKSFREAPHFQKLHGLPVSVLAERVKAGQVDKDGYVVL